MNSMQQDLRASRCYFQDPVTAAFYSNAGQMQKTASLSERFISSLPLSSDF